MKHQGEVFAANPSTGIKGPVCGEHWNIENVRRIFFVKTFSGTKSKKNSRFFLPLRKHGQHLKLICKQKLILGFYIFVGQC